VIRALIDRVPDHEPVIAAGWRVARLPDRLYPGLVTGDGQATGRLYTDLTPGEWATLDAFEDPIYTLTTLEVFPGPRLALSYVWPQAHLARSWTLDDLRPVDLVSYLERCRAWRARYRQSHDNDQ
jgi:hypothetical protein